MMDDMDFDERLLDTPDEKENADINIKESTGTSNFGHSLYMDDHKKSIGIKSWSDIRHDMAQGYTNSGVFGGTLRAIGIIALSIISLPVTLTRYLLLHEAEPFDFEGKLNNMLATDDMKAHNKRQQETDKDKQEGQDKELKPLKLEQSQDKTVTNDKIRIKDAVNSLRGEETVRNDKGNEIQRKTIAGIPYIGYTAKTGSLMFYSKDRKTIEVDINSNTIGTAETANKVAGIFSKKAIQQYKEDINTGLQAEPPVNPVTEKNLRTVSAIKAAMLLGAINLKLEEDKGDKDIISSVNIEDKLIELKLNPGTVISGEVKTEPTINILIDGEVKDSMTTSQLTVIKEDFIKDIMVQCDLVAGMSQKNAPEYVSVPHTDINEEELTPDEADNFFDTFETENEQEKEQIESAEQDTDMVEDRRTDNIKPEIPEHNEELDFEDEYDLDI